MRLRDRIENLRARANSYNYCVCPREQIEEIINYLETLEAIVIRAKEAEKEHKHTSITDYYNEGWEDCLEYLGLDVAINEE